MAQLTGFNCLKQSFSVSRCPFPRNQERINRNIKFWKAKRSDPARPKNIYAVGDRFANIGGPFKEELQEQQGFLEPAMLSLPDPLKLEPDTKAD